ncbi:MAG: NAD(P)H-dependent oxidoreductase [Alphaproteobacteria bacterium]|nr:NAD(P)H-dependent oxidoreductase [Alphaproteobacteria bacterium]MBU1561264.1 NAD(P)H-dependent oxidoreductase [Alphaproteobacteria bacterium]MBU2303808.1 NAD(P)H-dependent oxidoreductase [Alphaproteobacteria bacterium]MBU2367245.1 NAD(P)H-dependent oxidoreductase [Alphaproteobacteria bacterium]
MTASIALTGIARELAARAETGKPIRVGVIGSGEMGTDLVTQMSLMTGIEMAAIATRRPHTALAAMTIAYGEDSRGKVADSPAQATAAIEAGKIAITSAETLVTTPNIDVVIDATGKPGVAADYDLLAMEHGKHLVMMNVEADVTIGPYLKAQADRLGVVYSVGAGDEPSSCMELIEFVTALGLPIVAAGKGKNNPLKHDAVPDDYREEATRRNMNPRMLVEFVDGSKTMVEMCAIANATGLVPDVPGMHGPKADRDEMARVLIPKADGGILNRMGVVDFTVGKGVAPGVFVIVKATHPRIIERLDDLHIGHGPYYSFFRPYHLTSLEVPLTCARIMLHGKADMVPLPNPVAEVCAVAKRDLKPGESLDAIGETCYRSYTMTVVDSRAAGAVPVGLLEGGRTTAAIAKGELLTLANCTPDTTTRLHALRQAQDRMLGYS